MYNILGMFESNHILKMDYIVKKHIDHRQTQQTRTRTNKYNQTFVVTIKLIKIDYMV